MYNAPYNAPFMGAGMGGYAQPPMSYQPPQGQYPPPVQTQQAQDQRRTNAEWIPVSSVQQAREHIVQPNQILYFMNNNKSEFYAKSSDSFGTAVFKAFRFEEINPDAQVMPAQAAPMPDQKYLDSMNGRITALEEQMKRMTGGKKNEPDYADDERK